jgi:iron(III) transport system ATP-binding protein
MPDITVTALRKAFGTSTAVDSISFTVPDGSFTTLLGPSGCGKTTTLRMLAGLERPDSGEIRIGDSVVFSSESKKFIPVESRNVGIVFQSYALWPHMNVFDHVAYPLRVRRGRPEDIKRRVRTALELVGLADYMHRYPSEVSGGQQQRVALARALVFDPAVLLLDEPLSNLDAALRNTMREELSRLHRETGVTTVYVTHDQSEALNLSDQILLMQTGEIIERGSPTEVYENPRTVYGARFVGAANCFPAKVTKVEADMATVELTTGETLKTTTSWLKQTHVGNAVTVAIRPEDVVVSAPGKNANAVLSTVLHASYFGSHRELLVTVGNDEVKVHVPKADTSNAGDPLFLHMPPGQLRILPYAAGQSNPESSAAAAKSTVKA